MSNETNSEEADKQEKLDTPEEKTEEVPVMEESPKLITESDAPLNDKQQDKNVDFGTDGEYLPAAEERDKEATNKTDTTEGFVISEFGEQPNDEQQHEGYDDFGSYEDFFMDFARKHGLTCTRNKENPDFEISLKPEADENTTHIQIDHGRNLTMTATDNKNETVVPDQQMFNAIAMLAAEKKASITFGNIESDEYAARLYIACKNNEVPMRDIPNINLDELEPQTRDQYEKALANEKETTENQQNQTTDKATTDNQEEPYVEEGAQEEEEYVAIPIPTSFSDEAPTDNQEEVPVAEYDNNSNSVDNNATEHTEHNTTSEFEVGQSQEEDSNYTNIDEYFTKILKRMKKAEERKNQQNPTSDEITTDNQELDIAKEVVQEEKEVEFDQEAKEVEDVQAEKEVEVIQGKNGIAISITLDDTPTQINNHDTKRNRFNQLRGRTPKQQIRKKISTLTDQQRNLLSRIRSSLKSH